MTNTIRLSEDHWTKHLARLEHKGKRNQIVTGVAVAWYVCYHYMTMPTKYLTNTAQQKIITEYYVKWLQVQTKE